MALKIYDDKFWVNLTQQGGIPALKSLVDTINNGGGDLSTEFYAVTASYKGEKVYLSDFAASTNSISKGIASPEAIKLVAKGVYEGLKELVAKAGVQPTVDETPIKPKPVKPADIEAMVMTATPPPAGAPVPLSEATVLMQPVKGTDAGSVYRTIAFDNSNGIKVAARLKGSSLSIRAEASSIAGAKKMHEAFQSMGFSKSKEHWSIHVATEEAPASRIIGSILMGSGLPFSKVISPQSVDLLMMGVA